MKDFTTGSVRKHLLETAGPIALGMFFQTLYHLVDLYFIGELGATQLAGSSAAGTLMMIILALTQVLGVGAIALIAQAVGKKDQAQANLVFNQSMTLAMLMFGLTLLLGYWLSGYYMDMIAADEATREQGISYLYWLLPSFAMHFLLTSLGSGLRGTGIVKPAMQAQIISVIINALITPFCIDIFESNWGIGVAGAGFASSLSVLIGLLLILRYFIKLETYIQFDKGSLILNTQIIKRILAIGLPAGGEFALMFLLMSVIYSIIAVFGAEAQAGFGIGSRVMHSIFLPGMAIAFSIPPVAGQNFGAGDAIRSRQTFKQALIMVSGIMVLLTIICQIESRWLVTPFNDNPEVIWFAASYLSVISLNFIGSGITFACSGMFQAVGHTLPALFSSMTRIMTMIIPAFWLAGQQDFAIEHLWYLSVFSVASQALISLLLLGLYFKRYLPMPPKEEQQHG